MDIHTWFNLTYANYLVLPRSVLQSMPAEWQERFTAALGELDDAYGHLDWPAYNVRALKRPTEFIADDECKACEGTGEDVADGSHCPDCKGTGQLPAAQVEHRYETAEEVGFRTDPIPHYERGRTRIEPRPK